MWPWQEGDGDCALPRWHHWLLAAGILMLISTAMPILAAFS